MNFSPSPYERIPKVAQAGEAPRPVFGCFQKCGPIAQPAPDSGRPLLPPEGPLHPWSPSAAI